MIRRYRAHLLALRYLGIRGWAARWRALVATLGL
jgi:hypothetical protein